MLRNKFILLSILCTRNTNTICDNPIPIVAVSALGGAAAGYIFGLKGYLFSRVMQKIINNYEDETKQEKNLRTIESSLVNIKLVRERKEKSRLAKEMLAASIPLYEKLAESLQQKCPSLENKHEQNECDLKLQACNMLLRDMHYTKDIAKSNADNINNYYEQLKAFKESIKK